MLPSISDELTKQFYTWENKGRGWQVYDFPVDLEPPFVPFFYYALPEVQLIDDGRRTSLRSVIKNLFVGNPSHTKVSVPKVEPCLEPYKDDTDEPLAALTVALPKGHKVSTNEMERLLLMLSAKETPISFEIIAAIDSIQFQFVFRKSSYGYVNSQLVSHFPVSMITDLATDVSDVFPDGLEGYCHEYGLCHEFMRPIATPKSLDLDPYLAIFAAFDSIHEGEKAMIQILFKGAVNPWCGSILRSVIEIINPAVIYVISAVFYLVTGAFFSKINCSVSYPNLFAAS